VFRPRWLVGHMLIVVFAGGFVALGFWQLARNHQKQQRVDAAKAAYAAPAPDLAGAADPAAGARVEADGTYDPAGEALLRDQVLGDHAGFGVLTPLRLRDGTRVIVDRGWVASASNVTAPPATPVVVRGVARASRPLSDQSQVRDEAGRPTLPRVDVTRFAGPRLRTIWIEAQSQQPVPASGAPKLPQPPPPDPVNHMQYAIEWFLLALIPLIGWPIALRRLMRRQVNAAP